MRAVVTFGDRGWWLKGSVQGVGRFSVHGIQQARVLEWGCRCLLCLSPHLTQTHTHRQCSPGSLNDSINTRTYKKARYIVATSSVTIILSPKISEIWISFCYSQPYYWVLPCTTWTIFLLTLCRYSIWTTPTMFQLLKHRYLVNFLMLSFAI